MMFVKTALFAWIVCIVQCYIVDPGPEVQATKGAVWPKPQESTTYNEFYSIYPQKFQFKVVGASCSLLEDALQRYWKIINTPCSLEKKCYWQDVVTPPAELTGDSFLGTLTEFNINLKTPCADSDIPSAEMDESYKLTVSNKLNNISSLNANSIWGILRGLETFSQLVHLGEDNISFIINATSIKDFPRFSHRGLLLDTSRHFLPVQIILQNLDAMSYNKLNVFHWHIVDDQSFPYQSIKFPQLSEKGAYHPISKIYTQADITKIIEYARVRGIRVMPEFDTPGHTRSWGEGVKNILTPCYQNGKLTGQYGPLDPSKDSVYTFLEEFYGEVIHIFPDLYMHLGGDEVEFECWERNPDINNFMDKLNITDDYVALESYYINKLLNIITQLSAKTLVWEEVFVNGVEIPNNTIVHVWKDSGYKVLADATNAGKPSLLSSCWYLSQLQTGGDWDEFYECDPHNFDGTSEQKKLVLGGEACMWGENVNEFNVIPRVWPRASAVAEKLWSKMDADIYTEAAKRLEEHTCRMNRRGISAQPPNGPGFCL